MDGARVTLRTDAELERPPGDAKRAVGVSHAESWRRNIYASKLAHYTFLQWNQVYVYSCIISNCFKNRLFSSEPWICPMM